MSDLVGNPEDRFSRVAAQLMLIPKKRQACFLSRSVIMGSNQFYLKIANH